MTIKSDQWIKQMALDHDMITPFEDGQVRHLDGRSVISYGLSSYGYDMRIGTIFKVFTPSPAINGIIDPKRIDPQCFVEYDAATHGMAPCVVPPNSYALGNSLERFSIPRNVLVLVIGKSTYARAGVIVNVTPGEPGWTGFWTIEISNATPLPVLVYPNEGIAQCVFLESDEECITSYADRMGKYMDQPAVPVVSRM